MQKTRGLDILVLGALSFLFLSSSHAAPSVLSKYLQRYAVAPPQHPYHRVSDGANIVGSPHLKRNPPFPVKNHENAAGNNPCVDYPDHPFPCKHSDDCLPISYVCDQNADCGDSSDEDEKMCTAANRPPIEEIEDVMRSASDWILPMLFGGNSAEDVAHGLAVSPTLKTFADNLRLNREEVYHLKLALEAVKQNDEQLFKDIGMPPGQWHDLSYIFSNLISSGFDEVY